MAGKRRKSAGSGSLFIKAGKVFSSTDLLTEILLRLPAVSVIRFKCVAKLWYSIISDSKFTANHARLNIRPTASGLYLSPNTPHLDVKHLIPVSFDTHRTLPALSSLDITGCTVKYEDSSNGLFLCSYWEKGGPTQGYVVFNPTTNSYKFLPRPPAFYEHANLVYFPSEAFYKVVSVHGISTDSIKFQVFSSDTASWKQLVALVKESKFKPCHCRTRFVNWDGEIHWMDGYTESFHFRCDVKEEKLEVLAPPPKPKIYGCHKVWYFGECGGRLFLIQARVSTVTGFRVLEMGKGCSSWTVKFRFNLRTAFPEICPEVMVRDASVLRIVVGDENNDAEIVIVGIGEVISYNLRRKTLKVLSSSAPLYETRVSNDYGFEFQGSLASP